MQARSPSAASPFRTIPWPASRQLAYIPDNPDLYDFMTRHQVPQLYRRHLRRQRQRRGRSASAKYADLFELTDDLAQPIAAYSHGMKQKLAIISAWLHEPEAHHHGRALRGPRPQGVPPAQGHDAGGLRRRAARSSSPPTCWRWRKSSATRWPSSRAASSSAPAPWRRSRATTLWRRCSWNWRESHAENAC